MKMNPLAERMRRLFELPYIFFLMSSLLWGCDLDRIEPGDDQCLDPAVHSFEYSYAGSFRDSATAIVKLADGRYLMTGSTEKQGSKMLVYQTDLCRMPLLHLGIGENVVKQVGTGICELPNGDRIISGTQPVNFTGPSIYVARLDTQNTITDVWKGTFDMGITTNDMILLADGSLLLAGGMVVTGQFGSEQENTFFLRLSQDLEIIDSALTLTSFYSEILDVEQVSPGVWAGVGDVWIGFGYRGIYQITFNNGLSYSSTTFTFGTIGGDNSVHGTCLTKSSDGNVVLAGYYALLSGARNTFVRKIDPSGNLIWEFDYPNSLMETIGYHIPSAIVSTTDGGFAIIGTHKVGTTDTDIFLLKINANGEYQWDHSFGGDHPDIANDLIQETDGGYVIIGYTESFNASGETGRTYFLKTDVNGEIIN
jgi:hypothetical protein